MRITVEIEDTILSDLLKATGEKKMSPAISKAVTEFITRKKLKEFGSLLREGAFGDAFDGVTNEDIEARDR